MVSPPLLLVVLRKRTGTSQTAAANLLPEAVHLMTKKKGEEGLAPVQINQHTMGPFAPDLTLTVSLLEPLTHRNRKRQRQERASEQSSPGMIPFSSRRQFGLVPCLGFPEVQMSLGGHL